MLLGWNSVSFASLVTHSMSYSLGKRVLVSWIWLWCSLLVLCSALQTFLVVYEAETLVVFFHSGLNWQMVCPVQAWMDWKGILCVPGVFSYGAVESIVLAWQANTFNFVSWPVSCLYGWRLYGCKAGQQPRSSSKDWVTISGGWRSQYLLARQHSIVYQGLVQAITWVQINYGCKDKERIHQSKLGVFIINIYEILAWNL